MNKSIHATRLAMVSDLNGVVPERVRQQVLAEAQRARVTYTDFIRAHILTTRVGKVVMTDGLRNVAKKKT